MCIRDSAYTASAEPHIIKVEATAVTSPEEVWPDDGGVGADTKLDQFVSLEARNLYVKSKELRKNIIQIETKLSELRSQYAKRCV